MKIASLKKTKKGGFATSASVLEDLAFKGHKFPKLVLDWRQLSKLKNTYTDSLPEYINPNTKRVHTSFLLAATTTGIIVTKVVEKEFSEKIETFGTAISKKSETFKIKKNDLYDDL